MSESLAVVPVLVGPLQVLLAILPGIIVAVLSGLVSIFRPRAIKTMIQVLWRLKLQTAVVACCVAAAGWAAARYWPNFGPAAGAAEAGSDWPMFRGGPSRRGCAGRQTGPAGGGVNWAWKKSGEAFYASPAVVGNRVYVASATATALGSGSGKIYCFDADTGAVVWTSAPKGYRPTFSSPVVSGDRLVCGEGLHLTPDARIICLDVRPQAKGEVLWTFQTRSHVECSPVIADGRVFIGAGDDGYYCLDLATGREVWHKPGEGYLDAETSLAVHDGKVYAGLGLGGRALCVLDAETGRELKRIATPQAVFSPPAVYAGKLYIGMGAGDYVNSAEVAAGKEIAKRRARWAKEGKSAAAIEAAVGEAQHELAPGGQVWCVDLDDAGGRREWVFKTPRTVLGAIAVTADEVYFGSRDGCVYCLDRKTGRPITRADLHEPIKASLAVADEYVYAVTATGALFGLTRRTLAPVWEIKLSSAAATGEAEAMCISSPAVARGRIYVGTQQEGFLCVGRPGPPKVAVWAGREGNIDGSPLPAAGTLAWQWPYTDDEAGKTAEARIRAPAAAPPGRLIVPLATGPAPGVVCLPTDAQDGARPAPRWACKIASGVWTSPAVVGDRVFVVTGERQLHCLALDDGRPLWRAGVAEGASGVFQVSAEHVVIQDRPRHLSWFDLKGGRKQSADVGSLAHPPAVTAAMVVAATRKPARLVVFDAPTGRELWRRDLPVPPTASPAVGKTTVFVGMAAALEARKLTDGEVIWRVPIGVRGDVTLGRQHVAWVSQGGWLVVADRTYGQVVVKRQGVLPHSAPLISRGRVIYETFDPQSKRQDIMVIDLGAAPGKHKAVEWFQDTSWLGKPTTPMVLSGSKVFVGRTGWGLVCLTAEE